MDSLEAAPKPIQNRSGQHGGHYPIATRIRIEREYIQGLGTVALLARKHSIPEPTLRRWADENKWGRKRQQWIDKELAKTAKELEPDTEPLKGQDLNPVQNGQVTRVETITGQIRQIDDAIAAQPDTLTLLRLAQTKAVLDSLINPKPAPSKSRRIPSYSPPMIQPRPATEPVSNPDSALVSPLQEPSLGLTQDHPIPGTGPVQG